MKKVRSDILIAVAVVLCSLVLLGALSLAISGTDLNRPKGLLTIDLPNAVGLDRQAQVRYAGTIAGRIRTLRPLTDEERTKESPGCSIRVVVEIRHPLPILRVGTTATVISDTVLAEKYLNLTPGPVNNPALPAGTILYAKHSANLDEVMASGKELLDGVNTLLTKNDSAINKAILDLRNVLENMKVIATYGKTFVGTVARKPWRLVWGGPVPRLPTEEQILESDKPIPAPIPND
jgi:ABC-type transporter Mla subunit MlaD